MDAVRDLVGQGTLADAASMRALASLTADINTPAGSNSGMTPVCTAAYQGQEISIRALAALGADLNACSKNGWIPAFIAAAQGQVTSIRALAEFRTDVNTPANDGSTAVDCCS